MFPNCQIHLYCIPPVRGGNDLRGGGIILKKKYTLEMLPELTRNIAFFPPWILPFSSLPSSPRRCLTNTLYGVHTVIKGPVHTVVKGPVYIVVKGPVHTVV